MMPDQADRLVDRSSASDLQRSAPRESIESAFEQQVDRAPDNVAVQFGASCLTYRELDRDSNRLAQVVRRHLRSSDPIVAIYFERSLEMIVAMLAVLKAGAAYLPIDASNPSNRIEVILADASPALVLTHDVLVGSLPTTAM